MRLHILGSAGWIPNKNETSCFLVEEKNQLIMLDMGTGVSNLPRYRDIIDKYDTISIILSHYHLDHVIGIIYLLPYVKDKTINIYGPSVPFYSNTTQEYLEMILGNQFFSRPLLNIAKQVNCFNYNEDGFSINDVDVKIKSQIHSAPSFQITIDDKLIYATDTTFDEKLFKDVKANSVLLHECWDITSNEASSKHSTLTSILKGVSKMDFARVFLIHLNPEWMVKDYETINKTLNGTKITIANDGMVIDI